MLPRLIATGLCCVFAGGCNSAPAPSLPAGSDAVWVAEGVCYSLENGEERNRENPDTFPIPPRGVREGLQPGQIVKLMFAIAAGREVQVERIWVVVERRDGEDYVGVLDNQPMSTDKIRPGMPVRFRPGHVIAIHPKRVDEE